MINELKMNNLEKNNLEQITEKVTVHLLDCSHMNILDKCEETICETILKQ